MPINRYATDRLLLTAENLQTLINEIKTRTSSISIASYIFPIGYVWTTSKAPTDGGDPNQLFPGTYWKRIKDCFIWAAGDNDAVDDTKRGRNSVTTNDIPYHKHALGTSYTGEMTATGSGGGSTGTFTCSKGAAGSWSNSGIVTSRSQTSSGSYGGSGTGYQTSEYTLNIQHRHILPDTAGNYKSDNSTVQASTNTSMDIKNINVARYVWERITQEEYNQLQGV